MDWTTLDRRRDRPPRRPLVVSFAIHALLVVALLVWTALAPEAAQFESFQIEIVSALPATVDEEPVLAPAEEVVVETPEPEPPAPEPVPTPQPEPEPVVEEPPPDPEPDPPPPTPPAPPTEERRPPATDTATEAAEETGANVNVRLEGLRRDYPEYYNDIIGQINSCFRPPRGRFTTVVYFEIRRNGTVSGARLVERSGNPAFDYAALGAVECAGSGRFGPLPEDLPYDRLPVQFTFEPRGGGDR